MKQLTQILTVILIIILLTSSCKEDDEPLVEPDQITLPKNQLKPFELALIEFNSNIESQELYNGFIESENIDFIPNGNYLIFQVPTGSLGTKSGSVTINGEVFNFQYQLKANSFTDSGSYLQNYFAEQQIKQTELENLQDEFIQDSIPGFENIQADLTTWDQISNDAQTELAALSVDEKQKLAQLIDANSEWIQRLDDALLFRSIYSNTRSTAGECRSLIDRGRLELMEGRTFAAAGTAIEAYWCSLTFDERQYDDLTNDFERGTLLVTDVEFTPGLDVLNTLANLVFRKMDAITKELQGSISSNGIADEVLDAENRSTVITFGNGVPEEIFAKIRFRSINQNDVNTTGQAGEAATFFDQIISSYNEIVQASNQILIWRPRFTQSSITKDFNQFLTIPPTSVSNSDVILINTQYVDDKWEVAFGNDGNEQEPTFNFELIYDDGYIQLNKIVLGKIGDINILDDLFVIKTLRDINDLDVSNPLWNTTNVEEAITFLNTQQGIIIRNGRIAEIDFDNILEYRDNLAVLPPEIGDLTNLTKFDINYSQLTNLPAEIGNLSNLTFLQINHSNLITLPPEIENLNNLITLSIQVCELTSLPSEIGNIASLENLFLGYNDLTSIPSEIGNLTDLYILSLIGNENLKCLPQEVWDLIDTGTLIDAYQQTQISDVGDIDCNN